MECCKRLKKPNNRKKKKKRVGTNQWFEWRKNQSKIHGRISYLRSSKRNKIMVYQMVGTPKKKYTQNELTLSCPYKKSANTNVTNIPNINTDNRHSCYVGKGRYQ